MNLLFGCIYIPPLSSQHVYDEHCEVVEHISSQFPDNKLFLLGDYNLNTASWGYDEESGMIVNCPLSSPAVQVCEYINGLALHQTNSLPNNHGVFLDLLLTNDSSVNAFLANDLLLSNNFHHNAFCFDIPLAYKVEILPSNSYVYDFFKCDYEGLNSFLSKVHWKSVCDDANINNVVASFYDILSMGIDMFTPRKRIFTSSYPKWFSNELRFFTSEKKRAHYLFKGTRRDSDYSEFSALRTRCKQLAISATRSISLKLIVVLYPILAIFGSTMKSHEKPMGFQSSCI